MCINDKYVLLVGEYANRHYIKSFEKKYKSAWLETWSFIEIMCNRVDKYLLTTKVEKIHICDTWYIAKCEFTIAWLNMSPKTSGNRFIAYIDEKNKTIMILLLYAKTDYSGKNETVWWEQTIKENYKEISNLFSWL